ncbi:replication initiation protein [Paraburkholderia sp. J8-2]|uniref:replication initiation protein n=1 Tax=Paraburkholderia sp. J8-2 TaxID=2805440 RepID=UPI002AB6F75E|nr:replication initiation protein [Paraburkholderia sp. J8-2]
MSRKNDQKALPASSAAEKRKRIVVPQELRKHVAAIHMAGGLSFVERKIFNVLLANAYDGLLEKPQHSIPLAILSEIIGFDSKNIKALKEAVLKVMSTKLEFDLLKQSKDDWEAAPLLAYAGFKAGVCHYEFSNFLAQKFANPEVYTLINLNLQRNFDSGYALSLYENCLRFTGTGSTGFIEVATWRRLLGAEASTYDEFKFFNAQVLQKAIAMVNRISDIYIEPEFNRKNRRVVEIRFSVKVVEDRQNAGPTWVKDSDTANKIRESDTFKRLAAIGIGESLAISWIAQDPERAAKAALYVEDRISKNMVRTNAAGYARTVFESQASLDLGDGDVAPQRKPPSEAEQKRAAQEQAAELKGAQTRMAIKALSDEDRKQYAQLYVTGGGAATSYNPDTGAFRKVAERTAFTSWLTVEITRQMKAAAVEQ